MGKAAAVKGFPVRGEESFSRDRYGISSIRLNPLGVISPDLSGRAEEGQGERSELFDRPFKNSGVTPGERRRLPSQIQLQTAVRKVPDTGQPGERQFRGLE